VAVGFPSMPSARARGCFPRGGRRLSVRTGRARHAVPAAVRASAGGPSSRRVVNCIGERWMVAALWPWQSPVAVTDALTAVAACDRYAQRAPQQQHLVSVKGGAVASVDRPSPCLLHWRAVASRGVVVG